jgi:1,4-dihydroxy-2-naphthoate octaprenyltransferase
MALFSELKFIYRAVYLISTIQLNSWALACRPKTLAASVSPVLLGAALANYDGYFHPYIFLCALLCALLLQIAVNLANDLFDAKSGVDTDARIGPIRATQTGLISANHMRWALVFVTSLALLFGLILVLHSHWWLMVLGLAALCAVFAYSGGPYPLASHGLGEVTVLLFFGWLAVGGSYFVFTEDINLNVLGYGTVAGLLSAAIMLVNNIRDISTDQAANKNTLAVTLGDARARQLYRLLLVGALMLHLIVSIDLGLYSILSIIAVVPLMRSLMLQITIRQGVALNIQLAKTAQLVAVYCLSVAVVITLLSFA